ncbi:YbaB/EbfC family nucleoid-associated protein [Amycolatopsis palatopharyngis]|uniref:YbaB/EbfC family nucleoid-associated protein n=1 Tax=Amycolatopsis palatopharyngis TaxID=187982 RepID=UPI000E27F99E|nr:YbaB/EbfC family nucleoid-associated protein [Amycolatopsis palatopharyngis]
MTEHSARVEQLLAEYRDSREQLATVHRELSAVRASARAADGLVTATTGPRGTLTGLVIDEEAYRRYRPRELAEQIVRATAAAAERSLAAAAEVLAPALGEGTDPQALLLGTGDLAAEELAGGAASGEDDSFENQSWVGEARWPSAR